MFPVKGHMFKYQPFDLNFGGTVEVYWSFDFKRFHKAILNNNSIHLINNL